MNYVFLRVLSLLKQHGCFSTPQQVALSIFVRLPHHLTGVCLYTWVVRGTFENKVSYPRTQHSDPGKGSNPDCIPVCFPFAQGSTNDSSHSIALIKEVLQQQRDRKFSARLSLTGMPLRATYIFHCLCSLQEICLMDRFLMPVLFYICFKI